MTEGAPLIVGLDHVQLAMPRGEEDLARAFYAGVLGMTETPKPEPLAGRGGVWFESASTIVHVGVEEPFSPARKAHPAFLVSDLDAAAAALKDAGFIAERDRSLPQVARLYTSDPFGNRIELITAADGFSRRAP